MRHGQLFPLSRGYGPHPLQGNHAGILRTPLLRIHTIAQGSPDSGSDVSMCTLSIKTSRRHYMWLSDVPVIHEVLETVARAMLDYS